MDMPEIQAGLLDSLTEAVCVTLREMASTEAFARGSRRSPSSTTAHDISAALEMKDGKGALVLSFPEATAAALARRTLAEVAGEVGPDLIYDCAAEVANVVGGQAKALLHGSRYTFAFSPPSVVLGAGEPIPGGAGVDGQVIDFESDAGPFALQVCWRAG